MMKIGFDAKRVFNNFTGLGNYSRTLVDTLARYYPDNEYHLFTPKLTNDVRVDFIKNLAPISIHTPPPYLKPFHPIWRSYFIKNDVKKLNIDIFHGLSHELPLKLPKKTKTVVTIHDLIHERYPEFYPYFDRKIYSLKFKKACEKADVVVAISEQTKRDIVDFYNIEAAKIKVIYQSCHPQFYTSSTDESSVLRNTDDSSVLGRKYNLPENYILYVGTVNERKNLLSLVKAMQLLENQEDTHLVVIGTGGGYFEKVKHYVIENHLTNKIHFLTKTDFQDFPFLYKNAKAFVLPSFFEGFGIPVIEAMCSGCPVIVSEGSCFIESAGKGALFINPNSPESISAAIDKILTDKNLRNAQILRGGKYVEKFHEKVIGEQWMTLYKTLEGY
jgi:glycosyltransferase involved in cell wall biosynthesis